MINQRTARELLAAIAPILASCAGAVAQPDVTDPARKFIPAEERRLSTAVFREGLKQRGLHDLLELHLQDFPLQSPIDERLMQRDVELARAADLSRSSAEREAALETANGILEKLIADHPTELRRFQWMYALCYSLVFRVAEPYGTNILYFGGSHEDRAKLSKVAARAAALARGLTQAIADEYARIDTLDIEPLARLEKSGFLDELDRVAPNADYVLLWALFYNALAKDSADSSRDNDFSEIVATLKSNTSILLTPHEQSRVQVPAHTLAGMTLRRTGDIERGRQYLAEARSIGDRLPDEDQRTSALGAVILAEIEGIRLEVAAAQWHAASRGITQLRRRAEPDSATPVGAEQAFVINLLASLLERDVLLGRALEAEQAGRAADAAKLRQQSWRALLDLASSAPKQRDRMYALIYRSMDPEIDSATLDPVHKAAYIAGTLAAETSPEALSRAIAAGDQFLANLDQPSRALAPQVLRQMALAHYHRGDTLAAVHRFLQIAREYPNDPASGEAAEVAVHLTSLAGRESLAKTESRRPLPGIAGNMESAPRSPEQESLGRLYTEALKLLVETYPERPASKYWRYFYAENLAETGQFDAAVAQFRQVAPEHEHALDAMLRVIQVQAQAVRQMSADPEADPAVRRAWVDAVFNTHRELIQRLHSGPTAQLETDEIAARARVLAESRLTAAEVMVIPTVGRYDAALDELSGFEDRYGDRPELRPRLWRTRILAYARGGRLHEAMEVVSVYVQSDPENAGATLQALFIAAYEDFERNVGGSGDSEKIAAKRKSLLHLAKALSRWAEGQKDLNSTQKKSITVQLAEAHLAAGEPDACRQVLEPLVGSAEQPLPAGTDDLRALLAYAKALAASNRCEEALPRFNKIAVGLSPQSSFRWEGLYGDLQCRTALGHPPEGIVRVIQQQRAFHPSLGGPKYAALIEQLLRENERRRTGDPAPAKQDAP